MRRALLVIVMSVLGGTALAAAPTYFVKADMVRAAEGAMGPVCVPNSVFQPGEKIVFRAAVIDAATGEELTIDQVQARGIQAVVKFEGHDDIMMFFPPPDAPDHVVDDWLRKRLAHDKYMELFKQAQDAQIPILNANRFMILIGHVQR